MQEEADCDPGLFTPLAEGVYLEGLAVDHARGVIWYSDVIAGGIHGVRENGTPFATLDADRMWTGGVMLNADGAVLSSGQGGIRWNHPESGRSGWLITELHGTPVNGINEMWPDGAGGLFFGTNDIESVIAAKAPRPTAIYHLRQDRSLVLLADGLNFSNGLAYDPERARFHCSDTFGKGWSWDVGADFALTGKRVLLDRNDCDGMALDADGNVWICGVFSPGVVHRVTPEGQALDPLPTPPGAVTQLRFGGADGRDLYLNVVPEDAGQNLKDGKPLTGRSTLYRTRSPVAGVKQGTAAFDLD